MSAAPLGDLWGVLTNGRAVAVDPPPDPRCGAPAPNDTFWDWPDRVNAAGITMKQGPAAKLRGTLYWLSDNEACLRIDLQAVESEAAAAYTARGVPFVLRGQLLLGAWARVSGPELFEFSNPAPGHVYSVSTVVRCNAGSRQDCRTVGVQVMHPTPSSAPSIQIELRTGK